MHIIKIVLWSLLSVFLIVVGFYVGNYEKAKRDYEFKQECETQGGVVILDEHQDQFCLRRSDNAQQL